MILKLKFMEMYRLLMIFVLMFIGGQSSRKSREYKSIDVFKSFQLLLPRFADETCLTLSGQMIVNAELHLKSSANKGFRLTTVKQTHHSRYTSFLASKSRLSSLLFYQEHYQNISIYIAQEYTCMLFCAEGR